ncbi:biotin--[acetyl-CoA-carboxylase] ligase [Aquiflexum gelatinilyticum]|uniref:Biotin--[acetyl-CoA-carboxylase] ligase n=1 Tax=Aquiflexum gelatinilyticum TaxID=2961943 RepID=A0A9X2PCX2_9BACT|nr:biotin--[acetyl-CoA-carboxylase] ligase [Aquiflexum gelatinilyticum]MCR9017249.1 biotin--[acetyl-CoA-carboxylase] ligase [Aquiflexum gelatinilyticum]
MYKILANTVFLGKDIIYLTECHSTNDEALERLRRREITEGSIIFTDNQTRGRGQRGNVWLSQAGMNITFSLLLKPNFLIPSEQFYLNMIISLAVVELFLEYPDDIKIKWPNDILHRSDGKIGGILIENIINQKGIEYSVIGIGLNINQTVFEIPKVTSLRLLTGKDHERWELLQILVANIERRYMTLKKKEFKKIKADYLAHLYRFEEWAMFDDGEIFEGRIKGIDENGKLNIQKRDGRDCFYGMKEVAFL